jgi:hypothetical protein
MLRKIGIIAVLSLIVAALAAVPAFAGNPHFIKSATDATRSGNNLDVKFKEAGLESGSSVTVVASARAQAVYACVNGGGNVPSDAKKKAVNDTVKDSGVFTADKNGNITGTLTLEPPPSTLNCPGGQTDTLFSVTYSNVKVEDKTTGASISISGTF